MSDEVKVDVPRIERDGRVLAAWDEDRQVFYLTRVTLAPDEIRRLFALVIEYGL